MQTQIQTPVIETIINASKLLKKSKLDLEVISTSEAILHLDQYFETPTIETVLLVAVFQLSAESNFVGREDLARYFECNPIMFFKYEENFDSLLKRGYLEVPYRYRSKKVDRRIEYQVSDLVYSAIVSNKKIEIVSPEQKTDPVEILTDLCDIIDSRDSDKVDTRDLIDAYKDYLNIHKHSPLCNALMNMDLGFNEKIWLTAIIECNLRGKLDVEVERMGHSIFSGLADRINFNNSLHDKTNALIANKWIEFSTGGHFSNAKLKLTNKSKNILKPLGLEIRLDEVENNKLLILPDSIIKKKLFYNQSENQQVTSLGDSLKYRNHSKITKRLQEQGMRSGICTLLYGAPGTGKTESVYQIARETGRPLWKVDLTELKSMWFGESQKKVKALFDTYKELCSGQKRIPILLLNEADAILGTRNSNTQNPTQYADNAIQNIFLDCLEDFEGILFATTNLEKSLDPAFERRFLFKIEFERPEAEAQQQIWKAMLKELTTTQAKILSENYNLSGGEIENVLRKLSMMRILNDKVEVFKTVQELCVTEIIGLRKTKISVGYR